VTRSRDNYLENRRDYYSPDLNEIRAFIEYPLSIL